MKKISKLILLFAFFIITGWNVNLVSEIISKSAKMTSPSERISYISERLLGTPYAYDTLHGNPDTKEELVINLQGVDCFTYLDYVEAMRLSVSSDDFVEKLKSVRYFDSDVSYVKRRHFFTDWFSAERNSVTDITPEMPGAVTVEKIINRRSDTESWLKHVPQKMRMVTYLPSDKINKDIIKLLNSGDYIGAYTEKEGLDVTHTGIFIRNEDGEFFRNASSLEMKVTDYVFSDYTKKIKGIIILRAK